jgi:hypothetical protein
MTQAIQKINANPLEKVLLEGDLSQLSPQDRILYYQKTCESLGLNPLAKPFEYIKLNGKLTLYARKDATDQLRKINHVSIEKPDIQQIDNLIIVTVAARDRTGRSDSDIGVVAKTDMNGNLGNALMKAVTKAKRRVTLSICGLGMLDETELETIPEAQKQLQQPKRTLPDAVNQTVFAPPVEEPLNQELAELCSGLNTAGDSIKWSSLQLTEYSREFFDNPEVETFRHLSDENKQILIGDLTERLNELKAIAGEHEPQSEVETVEGEIVEDVLP